MKRIVAAVSVGACLCLVACGGSGGATTAEETPGTTRAAESPSSPGGGPSTSEKPVAGPDGGARDRGRGGEREEPTPVAPLRVTGGGSAQFQVRGGDNSIQEFGAEGDRRELEEAAVALHEFLASRVRGEWGRACALLSTSAVEDLESIAAQAPQLREGCAAALAAMTTKVSPSFARQFTTVEAASLRQDGEQAFLIYAGSPGKTVYAIPMRSEGGTWKPDAIAGSPLPGR